MEKTFIKDLSIVEYWRSIPNFFFNPQYYCKVCLSEIKSTKILIKLDCGHEMHEKCFNETKKCYLCLDKFIDLVDSKTENGIAICLIQNSKADPEIQQTVNIALSNISFVFSKEEYSYIKQFLKYEELECSICLNSEDLNDFTVTSCNHKFHFDCFKKLKKTKCPMCRRELNWEDKYKILSKYLETEKSCYIRCSECFEIIKNEILYVVLDCEKHFIHVTCKGMIFVRRMFGSMPKNCKICFS